MRRDRVLAGIRSRDARRLPAAAAALAIALAPVAAGAGQVSVTVSSNFFSPKYVRANAGDQVTWIWLGGSHTVTSGDTAACSASGPFNSGTQTGPGRAYSWKTPESAGSRAYVCLPHCFSGMFGAVFYVAPPSPPVPVADFRITEVRVTLDHSNDFVEIANFGSANGNLARYRLSLTGTTMQTIPVDNLIVPPAGRVTVWLGRGGTNTPTDIFLFAINTLPRTGSATLYTPMTVGLETVPTRDDLLVDFVQWGAAGQQNEVTAVTAGRWVTGEFVETPADGHSIAFCGALDQVGADGWMGIAAPNPGTADCSTPAAHSTWGRLKVTYR